MLTASAWASKNELNNKPWLILGKGPSFRKFAGVDAGKFHVLALNHVVREVKCDAALMMDFDVFESCRSAILENARFVLLPWRPHFAFRPTGRTLADMTRDDADLARLSREGRLVVFNAQTGRDYPPLPGEPIISIKFFSAEAALNILADNGVRNVRTLGIDGGASYADTFRDLNEKTLLANGRTHFGKQFEQFNQTLRRHPQLVFGPLDTQTPIRVFIGADPTQALGARLFEYSVRRFASMSTTFEVIDNEGLPEPADPLRRARTGFSFCRFKIPKLCRSRGRSIYVDADMQVFTDIKDLWQRDFEDAWVLYSELAGSDGRVPQFSVMLLDCANLDWDATDLIRRLDRGEFDYKNLMWDFAMMPAEKKKPLLEFEWNSLEHYEPGRTKLVHFTDMPTQPWVSDTNKHGGVWYAELRRAVQDGFVTQDDLFEEIARGHVSPLLPKWANLRAYPEGEKLAASWQPPYKRFARLLASAR
jgi:hypothetical protein